jgi:hypothetical protein
MSALRAAFRPSASKQCEAPPLKEEEYLSLTIEITQTQLNELSRKELFWSFPTFE